MASEFVARSAPAGTAQPRSARTDGPPAALVVEDDALIAYHLAAMLQRAGFRILDMVPSGEEALAAAAAGPPDLVLMDIRLAGELDGIEAARRLTERCAVPVVFLSANADAATRRRAEAVRPAAFLPKPVLPAELTAAVRRAVRS